MLTRVVKCKIRTSHTHAHANWVADQIKACHDANAPCGNRGLLGLAHARRRLLGLPHARRCLLHLRRASGYLGTSRGLPHGSSRRSSSTTRPRACSSLPTSPPPRVRVPRHVARLATRLVAPLVVDYSASRMLVVDYFTSAARLGNSARRAARHAARRATRRRLLRLAQARRRLLRLRRASECLGTSHGSSRGSSRRS
jgi:hypothetical protein